jgi:uncharacterized membrane protein YfcA
MNFSTLFDFAIAIISVAVGGGVHGALGFGFPMIPTPLLALATDVRTSVLHLLLPSIAINVVSIMRGGRLSRSIGQHWPLALFAAAGALVGTHLLIHTDPAPYKLLMAATLVFYLNVHRLGFGLGWVRRTRWLSSAVFGFTGGFLAGTVNAMVPPLAIYALELGLPPTVMVQVFNFCFLIGKLTQVVAFASAGMLTQSVLMASLPLCLAALAALAVGMMIRSRVPEATYRGWIRKSLFLIAVLLVVQYCGLRLAR